MGFLSPYRVLDLTNERGLLAGKLFADLGADVIQVEPAGGSSARRVGPFVADGPDAGSSLFWESYACNKRGITCDLETAEGRNLFLRLCASADFLFESEPPGVMARRGLSPADLQKINPRLIYTSITAFGTEGPKANYAESDLIVWASTTGLFFNQELGRPPVRITVPQAYLHASSDAANGALMAHFARLRSGLGQHVDISAQASVSQASLARILSFAIGDPTGCRADTPTIPEKGPRKIDTSGSGTATGRSKWAVNDGFVEMHLAMGPSAGKFTNSLIAWMFEEGHIDEATARQDWTTISDGLVAGTVGWDQIDRMYEIVAAFLRPFTKQQLMDAAIKRKLILAPILTIQDLDESPHIKAREFWMDVTTKSGRRLRLPGPFARTNVGAFAYRRPAPQLGEHNSEVLAKLTGSSGADPQPAGTGAHAAGALPLDDLKVLDLSWVVAGPAIARGLADYGATVIRVESSKRPETGRMVGPFHGGVQNAESSAIYGNGSAGKFGLTLDLATEEGRTVVKDLVRWADVLVESFSPGVMNRWGLGYDSLREIKPDLIMLSSSLMGVTGPYATFAGYGNVGAALSGFQNVAGWPDRPPKGPFGPYTDFVGPRFSLTTLLAALDHRHRTGEGCFLDVSQAEAGIHYLASAVADYSANRNVTQRLGNRDPQMAPHGVYSCRNSAAGDPAWVAIAVRDDAQWQRLATLVGRPELGGDAHFSSLDNRLLNADLLDEIIGAWTAQAASQDVEDRLQAQGIAAHIVANPVEALADPQLRFRGHFVELPHPLHGRTTIEGSRYKLSDTPAQFRRPAPTYGQHNRFVLRDILGYSADRIAELDNAGILK